MAFDYKIFASKALAGEIEEYPAIERGWGYTLENNDRKPTMKYMNYVFKRADEKLNDIRLEGIPPYDVNFTYSVGSVVKKDNYIYISQKDYNKGVNVTNDVYWRNVTPIATEEQAGIIKITSDHTGSSTQLVPNQQALRKAVKEAIVESFGEQGTVNVGYVSWGLIVEPNNVHLNGQILSKSAYPALWDYFNTKAPELKANSLIDWENEAKLNYGNCSKFVEIDSISFKIPCLKGFVSGNGQGYQNDDFMKNSDFNFVNAETFTTINGFWQIKAIAGVTNDTTTNLTNINNQLTLFDNKLTTLEKELDIISKQQQGVVIAWGRFDGFSSATVSIKYGEGFESITRLSTGIYRVVLTDKTFEFSVTSNSQQRDYIDRGFCNGSAIINVGEGVFDIYCGDNNTDAFYDSSNVYFVVIGGKK